MSDSISFSGFSLSEPILDTVKKLGYETPTPIQVESIPILLEGKDLLGKAQTGTGKTAAFALPLLTRMNIDRKQTQVLVLTPTRELAIQVCEAFQEYGRLLKGFKALPIYGGQDYSPQLRGLRNGAHVVVATPGRALDHLKRGTLKTGELSAVILDEADEMLRMGFIEDVETIISGAPDNAQMAMFSATMPAPVRRIAKRYLKEPAEINIASETMTVESVDQYYVFLNNRQKMEALKRLLEVEEYDRVLIFTRVKTATIEVAEKLEAQGFNVSALNGDMKQSARERTINRFKKGKLSIVVATDVAARGLDVENIGLVINYDIPDGAEPYTHRIGRTGRAGREGKAILFVTPKEKRLLKHIEKVTRQKIKPTEPPSNQKLEEKRAEFFKNQALSAFGRPLHFFHKYLDSLKQELGMSLEDLAPALLYMAQKNHPLQVNENTPELKLPKENDTWEKKGKRRGKFEKRNGKNRRSDLDIKFNRYRLDVGRHHKVRPGDIVGAIANEGEIKGRHIGHITIYDEYSTVELPAGMPKEIFRYLKKVHVKNRKMNLTLMNKSQNS